MLQSLTTYIRQRFKVAVFLPLALYLVAYALPDFTQFGNVFKSIFLILVLLFGFRLFDDLWNREIDFSKPERDYTKPENFIVLKRFLICFFVITFIALWFLKIGIAIAFLIFLTLNFAAYSALFKRWKWRFILPLLKYPFLCFLVILLFKNSEILLKDVLICGSVLSAFLLFEIFDDKDFSFKILTIILIFLAGNLLLLLANTVSIPAWSFVAIGVVIFTLIVKNPARFKALLSYAILIYFLILRLLVQL